MIPVKVCGITRLEDALVCVKHGVSALGFIFAPSQRLVTVEKVVEIGRQLPPFVMKVGVFVNEDPHYILEVMGECRLDIAQLHGEESIAEVEMLSGRVIKAFKAGYDRPGSEWKKANLRAILIDAFSPGLAGGSGLTFDWELFDSFRPLGFPLILAGGLHPGNTVSAIEKTRPDAVDVCSGVESGPGMKDPSKIGHFMKVIRSYESETTEQ